MSATGASELGTTYSCPMDTLKRTASLTLAAASGLVGLAGALAPAASATTFGNGSQNHVHVSSTYYDTKASCQSVADAYKKKVVAAGDELDSQADNDCKLETKGWTYNSHYAGDKVLSGDVVSQHSQAMTDALVKHGEEFTTYTHTQGFDTKAEADKAYASALAKIKSVDGKSAQIIRATPTYSIDEYGQYYYDISYAAKRHAPVFTGDGFDAITASTKAETVGTVGSKVSNENISFTVKYNDEDLAEAFARGALI